MNQTTRLWIIVALGRLNRAWLVAALIAVFAGGCVLSPPAVGLRPIYPKQLYGPELALRFVEVDSLRPTLKWRALPGQPGLVEHITYDVKVWLPGPATNIVYAREGLADPTHKLEQPLQPRTKYFWTFRACFENHGQKRVTQWSFSYWPWRPVDASDYHAISPRQLTQIPPDNAFRFQTP